LRAFRRRHRPGSARSRRTRPLSLCACTAGPFLCPRYLNEYNEKWQVRLLPSGARSTVGKPAHLVALLPTTISTQREVLALASIGSGRCWPECRRRSRNFCRHGDSHSFPRARRCEQPLSIWRAAICCRGSRRAVGSRRLRARRRATLGRAAVMRLRAVPDRVCHARQRPSDSFRSLRPHSGGRKTLRSFAGWNPSNASTVPTPAPCPL
jgi:hypothetical protein